MLFRSVLIIVGLCAPVMLSACGNEGAAEKAVRNVLNDPNSAIFSDVKSGAEKGSVCGLVNAKNRMGGYVGATPFFYRSSGQVAILSAPTESDFRMLWLRMKLPGVSNDDISNDIGELMLKCRAIAQWKGVCGSEPPLSAPKLCENMLPGSDGGALYSALKKEFDDN